MKKEASYNQLMHELSHFSGTGHTYAYKSFGQFSYNCTDGIMHLAQAGQCYWLLNEIAIAQVQEKFQAEDFQTWELEVNDKAEAVLSCHDGNKNYLLKREIPFTDIPLKNQKLKLYLVTGTLMLPSEY